MRNALKRGFIAAQVGEALANYALADEPLSARGPRRPPREADKDWIGRDQDIWLHLFKIYSDFEEPHRPPGFNLYHFAISEWVARVPGLYWLPGSAKMREVNPAQIESETEHWRTYTPRGKSEKVTGGIGTLRFPPGDDGFRLVTLTAGCNASSGVPALISPDLWDHRQLAEGCIINGHARWCKMPQKWAAQFPIVRGIPRGCLMFNDKTAVKKTHEGAPILIHPFSIMEYWDGSAQLHDFVYATADTSERGFRRELVEFFDHYRSAKGRAGTYLTAADISNPMWNAEFPDPGDMRVRKATELRILEQRVKDAASGHEVTSELIKKLSRLPDHTDLKRLSAKAEIPPQRWFTGGAIGKEASRLVDAAVQSGKQLALLHAVLLEVPA